MRKPTTGEVVGTTLGFGLGATLGVVVMRGLENDSTAANATTFPQVAAKIAHTENANGRPIGVRTYASPFGNEERGSRAEAARVNVVCLEPDGRDLVDTDVPADQSQNRGNDWYLLTATTDRSRWEWVNTSYTEITDAAGSAAVPQCATIEGLDPRQ